jgi:hypothetical protein
MRTILLTCFILVVVAVSASADLYMKHESHTDSYYYGGVVRPVQDNVVELWFGEGKMCVIAPNRKFVVDLDGNVMVFVNHDDSTYAETPLPLDWAQVADEGTAERLNRYPTKGVVAATKETKRIGSRDCACYEISSWIDVPDGRYRETDSKVWVTSDLPLDWDVFARLNRQYQKLQNNTDEFAGEMVAIRGFPIESEVDVYIKGFSVKSTEKVVEIEEKTPPAGTYDVPAGFTKKDKISMQDLR